MRVEIFSSSEWRELSADAHLTCFGEVNDPSRERINLALMAVDDAPVAYMTIRELCPETIYLQYGGAFPGTQGTVKSFRGYTLMLSKLSELGYKDALTNIENSNIPMLKFAMKAGFKIIGTRNYDGSVMVEHHLKM